jgi:hypothetical protein
LDELKIVSQMIGIALGITTLGMLVVGLMIRASISEATAKITHEIHTLLDDKYVAKQLYEMEIRGLHKELQKLKEERRTR